MTEDATKQGQTRDIVVVGASSGGLQAVAGVFRHLPPDIPAAFFVVLHLPANYGGDCAGALARRCPLPVRFAIDGQPIENGHVCVAPSDANMLLERGRTIVRASPRESFHRPSINALFRSAAMAYGRRVVGVVLSGILEDGAAGAWEIWHRGGIVIVQDPAEASYPDLPQHVLDTVPVDYCVGSVGIAELLQGFATRPSPARTVGAKTEARVMIVEDERIVARSLEKELESLHYDVCATAMTGDAAVAAAERTRPDVVLMDIRLAGPIDGTEAASRIWQRLQIPVVYLSAYADAETLSAIKRTNAYGYVMKPYEPKEVHVALQLALERHERENIR